MNEALGKFRTGELTTVDVVVLLYNDEQTVRKLVNQILLLAQHENAIRSVILVDSASPDSCGRIADELSAEHPEMVQSVHAHESGYARALKLGFATATSEYVAVVDGDGEYPVRYLSEGLQHCGAFDVILTRRSNKPYSNTRRLISLVYNVMVRMLFSVEFADIGSGLKIFRRDLHVFAQLKSRSSFIPAEVTIRMIGQLGRAIEISIVPELNTHRPSGVVRPREIALVLFDMARVWLSVQAISAKAST